MPDNQQRIQERQYEYPYHYIPSWSDGKFSQVRHWSWGYRYFGGIKIVLDQLKKFSFDSLLDVGCGDGRFLREISLRYSDVRLLGIDKSKRAISLANAINDFVTYKECNLLENSLNGDFDIATAIEVLEHIPPDKISVFLEAIAKSIKDKGCLILTVPHVNKVVTDKHYQHFTGMDLRKLLEPFFIHINLIPFDVRSRVMALLHRVVGGEGKHFLVTNQTLMSWFFKLYIYRYLYANDESKCMRIAAVCKK
jgi:2-polyprenyl-3-methyl-5-hydroxy-6-metoxy-1,4-benzoquinol methylase